MPYISTEEVKKIRVALKAALPKFKLSIRCEHYSSVYINVVSGPIDCSNSSLHRQVNEWHYKNHDYTQEQIDLLNKIFDTIKAVHPKFIESEDGDYGSIPNYYLNVSIGSWDKPYVRKA